VSEHCRAEPGTQHTAAYLIDAGTDNRTYNNEQTRSSADAQGPRDEPQIPKITLEKAFNRGMTLKDTQGHYNC